MIVTWPIFAILSLGGLWGSSLTTPFRFVGFVQYLSKMPSWIHFWRDLERDSAKTPLRKQVTMQPATMLGTVDIPLLDGLVLLAREVFRLWMLYGR